MICLKRRNQKFLTGGYHIPPPKGRAVIGIADKPIGPHERIWHLLRLQLSRGHKASSCGHPLRTGKLLGTLFPDNWVFF